MNNGTNIESGMNTSNGLTSGLTSMNVHSQPDDGMNVPSDALADASAESSQDAIDVLPPSDEEPQDEQSEWQRIALRWLDRLVVWRSEIVFDPESNYVFWWFALVALSVAYNLWSVIIRIAFSEMREQGWPRLVFGCCDFLTDLIYICDMLLQFRLGYLEDGIMVQDPRKLAQHYLQDRRSSCICDVIAALPVFTLSTVLLLFARIGSVFIPMLGNDRGTLFYPIMRLSKLSKVHCFRTFIYTWDMKTSNPNIYRAFKLLVYLATIIHWIGCFYYIVSEYEGLGTTPWVLPEPTETPENFGFGRKYLLSVYWSTMTLTTIGDTSSPNTNIEYVFTGVTFLIGVFMFATVVGNVGDVISNMNHARVEFQQKMDNIKFYMGHHNIPEDVQCRVKRWAEYSWNRTQAMDDQSSLSILPFRFRAEIAKHIHLDSLQKVKIFEDCEKGLLCDLVVRLRSQIYSPGDYICRRGEIGREMYIISHGKVEVLVSDPNSLDDDGTVVATLTEGNYFGEISLLKLDDQGASNRRNADVRSVGYSELLVLSKRDLTQSLTEYPDARQALERQARDRLNKSKEAIRIQKSQHERSLHVGLGSNFEVVQRSSVVERDPNLNKVKEREMSELRHILQDLRSFDSLTNKTRLNSLQSKCKALEEELRNKCKELDDTKRHTRYLSSQLNIVKQNGRNGVRHPVSTDDMSSGEDEQLIADFKRIRRRHRRRSSASMKYREKNNSNIENTITNGDVSHNTGDNNDDTVFSHHVTPLVENDTTSTHSNTSMSNSVISAGHNDTIRHTNSDSREFDQTLPKSGRHSCDPQSPISKNVSKKRTTSFEDAMARIPQFIDDVDESEESHQRAKPFILREDKRQIRLPAICVNDMEVFTTKTIMFTFRTKEYIDTERKLSCGNFGRDDLTADSGVMNEYDLDSDLTGLSSCSDTDS